LVAQQPAQQPVAVEHLAEVFDHNQGNSSFVAVHMTPSQQQPAMPLLQPPEVGSYLDKRHYNQQQGCRLVPLYWLDSMPVVEVVVPVEGVFVVVVEGLVVAVVVEVVGQVLVEPLVQELVGQQMEWLVVMVLPVQLEELQEQQVELPKSVLVVWV